MWETKGLGVYNVAIIGAGTAGLVTAAGTVGLGGRVALVERNKMGGDCLNYGCVSSWRRFKRRGEVLTTLSDLRLTARYLSGADPDVLAGGRLRPWPTRARAGKFCRIFPA